MKRAAGSMRLQLCSTDAELVTCATPRQGSCEASQWDTRVWTKVGAGRIAAHEHRILAASR
jgi:hypothetical protein